ncbi:hypothetical protein H5410_046416 [Solanum commersonii]|uniref:Uncharacterized protein n=1 Tax=Solanum commersonii TaxID=4109 RepID=A0A9J5XFL8_SOLCO|nr:hypothetical protein H5410_046416 [Solanum commersonii]
MFFCQRKGCEQQHDYVLTCVKEITNTIKEMTYNIDGHIAKNISHVETGVFVPAYADFLSDGLQVPSSKIISQSICMRYASLLWNYGILKAQSGNVNNNEDPHRPRPKKIKLHISR